MNRLARLMIFSTKPEVLNTPAAVDTRERVHIRDGIRVAW
jgi:hypothetical protein